MYSFLSTEELLSFAFVGRFGKRGIKCCLKVKSGRFKCLSTLFCAHLIKKKELFYALLHDGLDCA